MAKIYNETMILRRLVNIQKIHEALLEDENVSSYSAGDRIAYILWQKPFTRNNDIDLSINFYKLYYPSYVENGAIKLEDFFKIPKMYDIQRSRAEIQNTEGLFPAADEILKMRKKKAKEIKVSFQEYQRKALKLLPDNFLYFNKTNDDKKYFVLAGVLLNGATSNNAQKFKLQLLKKALCEKYELNIDELNFSEIKPENFEFYKEFITAIFHDGLPMTFLSVMIENKEIRQETAKNKFSQLLKKIIADLTSIIVRGTCASPYIDTKAKINIVYADNTFGIDEFEKEIVKLNLDMCLSKEFKYLIELESFNRIELKDDIMLQLAGLYANAIDNVFSEVKPQNDVEKCKKAIAMEFLNLIGLKDKEKPYSGNKSNIKFINKLVGSL